jgi:hypothetical protein
MKVSVNDIQLTGDEWVEEYEAEPQKMAQAHNGACAIPQR